MKKISFVIVFISLFVFNVVSGDHLVSAQEIPPAPDYSIDSSWVFKAKDISKKIDVFYVYPTIYADKTSTNMDIKNPDLQKVAQHLISSQAGVFARSANIYAPYYRQMSMAYLDPESNMYENKYFKTGCADVARAFEYYIKHINNGRPFILAGHSQGSMVLISLIRELFKEPELQKKLVAAYLIGYSVTSEDFKKYPWMKPAQQADDTGVIISYNTQSADAQNSPVLLPGAFCINPLSWKTDASKAGKEMNLGAVFFYGTNTAIDKEVPSYASAYIDINSGGLITKLPEKLDLKGFPDGVYHVYDYTLWFRNLEQNVQLRCQKYLQRANR